MRLPRLPRPRRLYHSRVAAGIALVLAAAAAGTAVRSLLDDDALPEAPPSTVDLVSDFAVAVTSFDHRTAAQDIAEVLDLGTRGFESEFRNAMGDDFLSGIEGSKSVSVSQIVAGPTLQSRVDESSTFLVVVNQSISTQVEGPASSEPASQDTSTTASPATPAAAPRVVRVGMLVTVDEASSKVESVQIL
ncbi:MAG: hypothetical protein Q8K58_01085 [Acidimicrobiales bacterium]|nr:hypothetical protein [Acidimicrobiales bacterium]